MLRSQEGTCRAALGLTLREVRAGADAGWRFARRADEGPPCWPVVRTTVPVQGPEATLASNAERDLHAHHPTDQAKENVGRPTGREGAKTAGQAPHVR